MLIDNKYGPLIPAHLTVMPQKAALYSTDTYFWEGWEDLVAVAGEANAQPLSHSHSMLLLKPDAICSRKLETILQWLPENGFSVVACTTVVPGRHQVRALWQYQWNTAPRLRKEALETLLGAARSLLLVIRSSKDLHVAASLRFARLKGLADPKLQRPGDLRARLGNKTHLISFVHAADEPADFVRELAILLPEAERKVLFAKVRDALEAPSDELRQLVTGSYATVPEHSLELGDAVARLRAATQACMQPGTEGFRVAEQLLEKIRPGASMDWPLLFETLDKNGVSYAPWDRITIAGHMSDVSHPGVLPLIPGPPLS